VQNLLTVGETADVLRLSRGSVYRLVERGDLAAVRLGSGRRPRLRIDPADVDRFLTRTGAPPENERTIP